MRGGIWQDDKHTAFIALGNLLFHLKVLDENVWFYHFNFEPNPLIRQYEMFIEPFNPKKE